MAEETAPRRRVNILATLGAELSRLNLSYDDRDALRAVLAMRLEDFLDAAPQVHDYLRMPLGIVVAEMVCTNSLALNEMGLAVLHQRRSDEYHADCARWNAQSEAVKRGAWRERPPTRGQRMLILRTVETLGISLPGKLTRGEAHDWIEAHGGNLRYATEA